MVWSNRLVTALLAWGGFLSASCFLVLPTAFAGWNGTEAQPQTVAGRPAAAPDYGKLPISFEANQGQSDTQVRFLSHGHGYSLFLTDSAAVLALEKRNPPRRATVRAIHSAPDVVRMEIVGAQTARVSGAAPLPGVTNYFIGNDPAKWQRHVRTYAQVKYQGVYPGIDLLYYGNQQQLEYDFVVAPGADPQPIRLHFAGARRVKLAGNGDLQIRGKDGAIAFRKPVVYQLKDGVREPVEGRFALLAKNTVGFRVGAFDHQRELVIDPTLAYSTYLGGGTGSGIAIDQTGNAYVAGSTDSTNFPVTSGAFQKTNGGAACGNFNAFVTKLNPEGSALVYSTYLGGVCDGSAGLPSVTFADDVAVDSAGNAYITGSDYSGSFPVTSDAFQKVNHAANIGGSNAFVAKLDPSGSSLIYSTYLGGSGVQTGASTAEGDGGSSIALDSSGNVYVTGSAASLDFPVTSSAFQRTNKASSVALFNAFVTKLNSTGSALVYSTYLGGSGGAAASAGDYATGIALDGAGEAFVAGQTASSDFPITKSSFQKVNHAAMNGSSNAFITKLNADGSSLIYSTYLGGSGKYGDYAATIAVDHDGNAYAAGGTYSSDFPVTSGAFQQTTHAAAQGYENGFVAKLNPEGTRLVYSTYLGGTTSSAEVNGIAVDASGRAYLTGLTDPRAAEFNDFPVTADAYEQEDQVSYPAFQAFLTEINTDGSSLDYSTVLGSITEGVGIALDKGRSAYVTGSTCFGVPTTSHAYKPEGPANVECTAFVSKFGAADTRAILPSVTKIIPYGKNPQFAGVDLFYGVTVLPGPGSSLLTGSVNILVDGSLLDTLSVNNLTGPPSFEAHGLTEGKHLIEAEYSGDEHYSPSDAKFEQTLAGAVSRISIVSGDRQEGIIGSAFAEPLVVLVRDNAGKPAPGVPVYYYSPSVGLSAQNVTTDSYGEASVTAIPEASGKLTVGVSINGGSYPSVVFYLTAVKP